MTRMRRILVPALLLMLVPFATAQHVGPAHFGGATSFHGGHFGPRGFQRGYFPLGLSNGFYDDYLSDAGYPVPAQPQVIVLQPPQTAPVTEPAPAPAQPLMIELQGDRYVQISGEQSSHSEMIDSPSPAKLVTRSNHPAISDSSTPAVLIFRDGHREEVSAYTIAGSTLYASSNYATTGSWNQKIELSALNVPETIAANSDHPHPFRIPSAANEVIVGP
ncbi:MAG TPA: hypothetical protein VMP68_20740 [Candidatus Eisenbacteria bacterium]|nr:hypothetical protein [Candidatus Eisenbacteria bacterium]